MNWHNRHFRLDFVFEAPLWLLILVAVVVTAAVVGSFLV